MSEKRMKKVAELLPSPDLFLRRCWTHCIKTSWTVFFGAAVTIIIEARAVSIFALNNSGRAQSFVPCCWRIVPACCLHLFSL